MKNNQTYDYQYDDVNDVYIINRIDDKLNYDVPQKLLIQLFHEIMFQKQTMIVVSDFNKIIHYSKDGETAILDLNQRYFNEKEIEMILAFKKIENYEPNYDEEKLENSSSKPKILSKILNKFIKN